MTIQELKNSLRGSEHKSLSLVLPNDIEVPPHFHVTEVGYVKKAFVDCGGKRRTEEKCLLQIWVADDVDHRVTVGTLFDILKHGDAVLPSEDLDVEFEYEYSHLCQFGLSEVRSEAYNVTLAFENKHTDCLAKELCGIPDAEDDSGCSTTSGCC